MSQSHDTLKGNHMIAQAQEGPGQEGPTSSPKKDQARKEHAAADYPLSFGHIPAAKALQ